MTLAPMVFATWYALSERSMASSKRPWASDSYPKLRREVDSRSRSPWERAKERLRSYAFFAEDDWDRSLAKIPKAWNKAPQLATSEPLHRFRASLRRCSDSGSWCMRILANATSVKIETSDSGWPEGSGCVSRRFTVSSNSPSSNSVLASRILNLRAHSGLELRNRLYPRPASSRHLVSSPWIKSS